MTSSSCPRHHRRVAACSIACDRILRLCARVAPLQFPFTSCRAIWRCPAPCIVVPDVRATTASRPRGPRASMRIHIAPPPPPGSQCILPRYSSVLCSVLMLGFVAQHHHPTSTHHATLTTIRRLGSNASACGTHTIHVSLHTHLRTMRASWKYILNSSFVERKTKGTAPFAGHDDTMTTARTGGLLFFSPAPRARGLRARSIFSSSRVVVRDDCSAHRAQYPRVCEFAYSRAPPRAPT